MESQKMKRTLLLVDDDIHVLNALKRLLHAQDYHILTATSGAEALQKLAQHQVSVIISDLRMPEMTGVEFFSQVVQRWPDTIRIILSAYADFSAVTDAINLGAISKFFTKPWKNQQMCEDIKKAFYSADLKQKNEQRFKYQEGHDQLTKLPNRKSFDTKLQESMLDAEQNNKEIVIIVVALDRFKNINDSLGRVAGDQLLQNMAQRLEHCIGDNDIVARIGGDEFIIMIPNVKERSAAKKLAKELLFSLSQSLRIEEYKLVVTASIGISLYPQDSTLSEILIKNAESAMYRAKDLGKNQYQFYCSDISTSTTEHLTLETQLRYALKYNEFRLFYQPKVDISTGQLIGFEALVRWQNPELGLLPPGKFIVLLEEIGLIVHVGEWVLNQACYQNNEWRKAGLLPIQVAVNVSSYQFQAVNFIQVVEQAIKSSGLAAQGLEIEITEDTLINNIEQCRDILEHFRALGISIAIDDFGTGYSSLSYLKHFPVDLLKIDQSFIKELDVNPQDLKIVASIITMAHDLDLKVIAEGVENQAQLQKLIDLNCDQIQGYFIDRPLTAEQATQLLKSCADTSLLKSRIIDKNQGS